MLMKRIRTSLRIIVTAFWLALLAGSNGVAQQVNVDAAKKEGKVVVYGSVLPQAMDGLNQAFKKKYGIEVEYWRGSSTRVSERALTEWRAGKPGFDVIEASRGVQLILKEDGLFQKFLPPSAEKFPASGMRWPAWQCRSTTDCCCSIIRAACI